jgi:hypothetical protein
MFHKKTARFYLPILLIVALAFSCSDSGTPEPSLFFRGGMDSVTIVNEAGTLEFEGWNSLRFHEYVADFNINNSGGIDYAYQEIVNNPFKAGEKVMHAVVLNDDPNFSVTSRAQITMTLKDNVNLDYYHTSVRMLLDEDVAFLKNYPGNVTWFELFEAWTDRVSAWDGNSAGSARWNLSLAKAEADANFHWVAEAETMQPASMEDQSMWKYDNTTVDVPFNKWFTLDIALKRGSGNNGQLTIQITPDGEKTKTLFNIKNTTIYPGHPEIFLNKWQPFKFYFSDSYLDWMKANNKVLSCYYNDFKWYKK